jgi:predicted nucleic acid-binding protein
VIYLDSSAVVKMIRPEAESRDLVEWLNGRNEPAVTSVLAEVEVPRALRRSGPVHLAAMPGVLARISRVEMDASIRATAGAYVTDTLRSLDAIHLATAEVLAASGRTVSAFVTYDRRQAAAAEGAGFPVRSPGRVPLRP